MTTKERSRIVVSTQRNRSENLRRDFHFSESDIPNDHLKDLRHQAWVEYAKLEIPTTAEEAWRRTDLRQLPLGMFKFSSQKEAAVHPGIPESLLTPLIADMHGGQVVLSSTSPAVNSLAPSLENLGVVFCDLRTAVEKHPQMVGRLAGKLVPPTAGKFSALVSALAQDGVFLYVPRNVHVEMPLRSIFWGPGGGLAHLSHILVWVDDGASVTYVHEAASNEEPVPSMHAGIVEIEVGHGANFKFVELQSWGRHVWNFSHEHVRVGGGANLDWIFGAVGSRLTKNFSDLDLAGEGAVGRMSGFYFADGEQHLDHDTQQLHHAPNTISDLLYKGALKGNSRSVWQGMIYVAPDAQRTDGYQANRNLVLSPNAHADSIPGLEILADDVRCTHGATVGKLDQEPLFYLTSRGIPYPDAEMLMVEGFFDPIMQRIPFEGVRARFQQAIHQKMETDS